jgi:predicted acetyltransferase
MLEAGMDATSDITVRTIAEAEFDKFQNAINRGFGGDPPSKADAYPIAKVLEPARSFAAFDGDSIVGTCAAFSLDLTVPGGVLPMGGTTMVTVHPTHRRRGLLRRMMQAHLDEVRSHGDPIAGLWCSESSIYQQFGYGLAVEHYEMDADADRIHFIGAAPSQDIRAIEFEEARKILPEIFDAVRSTRPGMFSRSAGWWEAEVFRDVESEREGRTAKRIVISQGDGGVEGYAIYRQRPKWPEFPENEIYLTELFAKTASARLALWRFMMNIDLHPKVQFWNMPIDDELFWCVSEPRRLRRRINDSLWIRVLDIPRALSSRAYADTGTCVLGIRDPFLPENDGSYRLTVNSAGAECRATSEEPAIRCDINAVGSLFLGGNRATTLSRAGLITGDPDSIRKLERMFAWSPLPWCPEIF